MTPKKWLHRYSPLRGKLPNKGCDICPNDYEWKLFSKMSYEQLKLKHRYRFDGWYQKERSESKSQSLVSHVDCDWRKHESCIREEGNEWGPVVHQVSVELVLSCVIMEMELSLLICMIMVLGSRCSAKSKEAHLVANAQSKHHCLHSGRVMEHRSIVSLAPFLRVLPCALHEVLDGVILDNSIAENVKTRIGDDNGRLMRSWAEGNVHQMH